MATGREILELARKHLGEPYVFGARAPLKNPDWTGPWDCAEFASWCLYQAAVIIYGARPDNDPLLADPYTGFWSEQSLLGDARIAVADAAAIAGSFVLRIPSRLHTGHIAISDGRGGTVEAHSTVRGVVTDEISGRRWDTGILVPGIDYFRSEEVVPLLPPGTILRVTTPLTRGVGILALQKKLLERGYPVGTLDGIYGPQTAAAVQRFQLDQGLAPDGEFGPRTARAMGESP